MDAVEHYEVTDPVVCSPEFVAWAEGEGVDLDVTWLLSVCRRVIRGSLVWIAMIGEYRRNDSGRFFVVDGEVARTSRVVLISGPPPRVA